MFAMRESNVVNIDVETYAENLRATKPPYECPIGGCGRVYKSYTGIHQHLSNHDNPQSPQVSRASTPTSRRKTPGFARSRKKRRHWSNVNRKQNSTPVACSPSPSKFQIRTPPRENLSYAESQRQVEVELEGNTYRINIYEPLEIISQGEMDNWSNAEKEEKLEKNSTPNNKVNCKSKTPGKNSAKTPGKTPGKSKNKSKQQSAQTPSNPAKLQLPEAVYVTLDDYVRPHKPPSKAKSSYYRFIEKSQDELDEEVEYDMDEEDYAWLELINEQRRGDHHPSMTQEVFEMLMDRFEKEAFFQSQTCGGDPQPSIDEDAVCGICMDGECQNSNVILFCDMCNLAVHQECYGVPYIPEGQWLCRRCLQSPSRPVDCCLCPNKGGAFKQTDDARWAHVVCALWIPEVGFANTVFLEPIDSIERIPSARWKLTCYICKQRGSGACIQCHKTNCYTAFHVTCAQQAGLFMKIEPVRDANTPSSAGATVSVRKTAFCDTHTPANMEFRPMINNGVDDGTPSPADVKAKSRLKMRKARKILAEKRNAVPVVSIPIIPKDRVEKIAYTVLNKKKTKLINRLLSYWTLKRQARNGVPLLRRLQSNHMSRSRDADNNDKESSALKEQMKYWQRLRQDLEKARLLVELIRKREKLKREQLRFHEMATEMKLQPFMCVLRTTLELLQEVDTQKIFAEPVPLEEVPDYLDYVKVPMDFSTMKKLIAAHQYTSVESFERDFDLVVHNCMAYNSKDTIFYRAAVKLRDQGGAILRNMRRNVERIGIEPATGVHYSEPPVLSEKEINTLSEAESVDTFLPPASRGSMPLEQQLQILLDKLDHAEALRKNKKSKLCKQIRKEVTNVRRKLAIQKGSVSGIGTKNETISGTSMDGAAPGTVMVSPLDEDDDDDEKMNTETEIESVASTASSRSQSPEDPASLPTVHTTRSHATRSSDRHQEKPAETERKVEKELEKDDPPVITSARGRGRGGRARTRSTRSTIDSIDDTVNNKMDKVSPSRSEKDLSNEQPPAASTPSGVNRRTAVLFKKSARKAQKPSQPEQVVTEKGDCGGTEGTTGDNKKNYQVDGTDTEVDIDDEVTLPTLTRQQPTSKRKGKARSRKGNGPCMELRDEENPASPNTRRKRSASTAGFPAVLHSPKSPPTRRSMSLSEQPPTLLPEVAFNTQSFTQYRQSSAKIGSDMDTTSDDYSTDGCMTDSSSDSDSSGDEGEHSHSSHRSHYEDTRLEPLDLVWAKCRGYPWYPALIINPKMPRTGYFHNGVPIPVPPEDVLGLREKQQEYSFLVLFFDTKRTWQWLPPNKLQSLGVDTALDKVKLLENKKPNIRKAVRNAYDNAISHKCRVTGETVTLMDITDAADAAGLTTTAPDTDTEEG